MAQSRNGIALTNSCFWGAGSSSIGVVRGENMNLAASLAVLAVSLAMLFFGRGRNGDALPIFQKSPWIVSQPSAMAILYLFAASLMGVAVNLNWLR